MALNLREVEVFNPYSTEAPEDLLWQEGLSEEAVERWMAADLVRVAKRGEEVLAIYAMDRGDELTYVLHGIVVAPRWRKQGLGRWLVGHAIGVAESKGGRHVLYPGTGSARFLGNIGFIEDSRGRRFDLIPE